MLSRLMTNEYLKFKFIIISLVNKFNNSFNDFIDSTLRNTGSVDNTVHNLIPACE